MMFAAFFRLVAASVWISWYHCFFVCIHVQLFQLQPCVAVRGKSSMLRQVLIEPPRGRSVIQLGIIAAAGINTRLQRNVFNRLAEMDDDGSDDDTDLLKMLGSRRAKRKADDMSRDGDNNLLGQADLEVCWYMSSCISCNDEISEVARAPGFVAFFTFCVNEGFLDEAPPPAALAPKAGVLFPEVEAIDGGNDNGNGDAFVKALPG